MGARLLGCAALMSESEMVIIGPRQICFSLTVPSGVGRRLVVLGGVARGLVVPGGVARGLVVPGGVVGRGAGRGCKEKRVFSKRFD